MDCSRNLNHINNAGQDNINTLTNHNLNQSTYNNSCLSTDSEELSRLIYGIQIKKFVSFCLVCQKEIMKDEEYDQFN